MKLHPWIPGAALAATLLAACGASPPLRYYALDVVAPAANAPHSPATTLIRVRHISLPPEMDHRGLTHHQGATQLAISDRLHGVWIEPSEGEPVLSDAWLG